MSNRDDINRNNLRDKLENTPYADLQKKPHKIKPLDISYFESILTKDTIERYEQWSKESGENS